MGLTEFALSQALKMALTHVDRSGIVVNTARQLDELADEKLGERGSEAFQHRIVTNILLPLAKELLKENPDEFKRILQATAEPWRLTEEESKRLLGGRQETPTTNFVPKVRNGSVHND